jgi:hypothetical protein
LQAAWHRRPRPRDYRTGWSFQPPRAWPAVRRA